MQSFTSDFVKLLSYERETGTLPTDDTTTQIVNAFKAMFSQYRAGASRTITRTTYRNNRFCPMLLQPFYLICQGLLWNMYRIENAALFHFAIGPDIQNDGTLMIDETNSLYRVDPLGTENTRCQGCPCQQTKYGE